MILKEAQRKHLRKYIRKAEYNKKSTRINVSWIFYINGDYLYDIVLTLLVYDITGTIDSIAVMWISKGALRIFIQYFAGILTDKYNRRNII